MSHGTVSAAAPHHRGGGLPTAMSRGRTAAAVTIGQVPTTFLDSTQSMANYSRSGALSPTRGRDTLEDGTGGAPHPTRGKSTLDHSTTGAPPPTRGRGTLDLRTGGAPPPHQEEGYA